MSTILVVTEIRDGQLKSVNLEALTAARQIANSRGETVTALLLGATHSNLAQACARYGANKTVIADSEHLASNSPDAQAAAIVATAKSMQPTLILAGATAVNKDLMARVAFALDTALAQDCVEYQISDDQLSFVRPMYAGKTLARVTVSSSPAMATLRAKSVKAVEEAVDGTTENLQVEIPAPKVVVDSVEFSKSDKISVTEADIIVSGGRGMQGPEHWPVLESLAEALGAATGCSRPVSDEGWRPHGEHIGQTGVTVSPDLYIACGISGAIQHLAGMSSSKYIVAINKDPEAPIFKAADYGIVGDVFDVLPAFTEAVRQLKAND